MVVDRCDFLMEQPVVGCRMPALAFLSQPRAVSASELADQSHVRPRKQPERGSLCVLWVAMFDFRRRQATGNLITQMSPRRWWTAKHFNYLERPADLLNFARSTC